MTINKNNVYSNTVVKLDGNEFDNCTFTNCTLEYSGLGPVGLVNSKFTNVKWVFSGPAKNTINFLSALYQGMGDAGKDLVEKTFENIKMRNNV